MKYIKGYNRNQLALFPISIDEAIEQDNEVRLIDLFIESLDIKAMGFKVDHIENGRPAYHPKDLLKLYLYGYMNRIRSSRQLERACKINIEVMWLLKGLSPDHNTISNFRKDNPKAIKKVFRASVSLAQSFELIGSKLIAGDSTKFRAQNSKKNNFNQKKIDRHLAYIDSKLAEYEKLLSESENSENSETKQSLPNKEEIKKEIEKHKQRKATYTSLSTQLKESNEKQISTSDPESRQMITRNNITEVAYNVQATIDSTYNLPIDYKVTNANDSKAMGMMLRRAKTILRSNSYTALYDKGYHTGSEFKIANELGINVLVAIPSVATNAPDKAYNVEHFTYYEEGDYYLCPEGNKLHTTGKWHQAKTYKFKRYTSKSCLQCTVKAKCSKAKYGKAIQRSEYQELIENNKKRITEHQNYYRKRQAIVEHPFGTFKRQWGFSYIITKKYIKRAEADVGLIFTSYNFRRIINIIGFKNLKNHLQKVLILFYTQILLTGSQKIRFKPINIYISFFNFFSITSEKSLYLQKINGITVNEQGFWTNCRCASCKKKT